MSGLFFSLALQPALQALKDKDYKLVIAYLDDVYIICSRSQAQELVNGGLQQALADQQVGLTVNARKTAVFFPTEPPPDDGSVWNCAVQSDGSVVLGTPVGKPEFIVAHLQEALKTFESTISTFTQLSTQAALLLLRACGITRLNHFLRSTPSVLSAPFAGRARDHIWNTINTILDIPDEETATRLHFNRIRARTASELPISMGGLGMTNLFDTLSGAFLAGLKDGVQVLEKHFPADYAWWTSFLPSDTATDFLDLEKFRVSAKRSLGKVRTAFDTFKTTPTFLSQRTESGDPLSEADINQRYPLTIEHVFDARSGLQERLTWMVHHNKHNTFLTTLPASLRALALGRASRHAQDFLIMHPSCKIHQLTSEDMKFAARGLLYLPPTNEDYLHVSPSQVLTDGTGPPDAFIAFRGLFRASHAWPRHDSLTQLFNTMLKRSGYRTRLEVQVPNAGSRGRVDIVAYGLFHNTDVAFDVSVTTADTVDTITQASAEVGFAAKKRARLKESKYTAACRAQGLTFRPLILEDTGYLDASVTALFAQLSRSDTFEESVPEFTTWAARTPLEYWFQGVSRHLVAGNAKMFRAMRLKWVGLRGRPGDSSRLA